MANQEGINISNPAVDPGVDERLQTKSIADTLGKIEECRAFADWVRKSGLDVLLSRTGLHTLFAVQDSAFQAPESGRPEEFLNRQLLNGASQTFDLSRCKQVKTASGEIFRFLKGAAASGALASSMGTSPVRMARSMSSMPRCRLLQIELVLRGCGLGQSPRI